MRWVLRQSLQRIPVRVVFDRDSVREFEQATTPGMLVEVTVETASN
ncbi:hypothetical protein H6F51_20940 [Cyanobacteria bacterium FACHB-DQ100]|nr:hypothetical protein [Cyanobacteria bacterium FACHB-DQ100]